MFWLLLGLATAGEQEVSLETMMAHAKTVVVAEVTSSEARYESGERGDIETVVWLATEKVLKGEAPDTLEILVEGGQIGEHRTVVSNQPVLELDHRYLLVLVEDEQGRTRVIGQQGAIEMNEATDPPPILKSPKPSPVEAE